VASSCPGVTLPTTGYEPRVRPLWREKARQKHETRTGTETATGTETGTGRDRDRNRDRDRDRESERARWRQRQTQTQRHRERQMLFQQEVTSLTTFALLSAKPPQPQALNSSDMSLRLWKYFPFKSHEKPLLGHTSWVSVIHCYLSQQRFHFCLETFHSRLLSRWTAQSRSKGDPRNPKTRNPKP